MFRIYTEDKGEVGRQRVFRVLTGAGIDGATVYRATGFWRGILEDALVIDLDGIDKYTAAEIAADIKSELSQDAVLFVEIASQSTLLK